MGDIVYSLSAATRSCISTAAAFGGVIAIVFTANAHRW
jgi:hypothetical protein